jgi:thiol-disulfide isomerase/thioredoxin
VSRESRTGAALALVFLTGAIPRAAAPPWPDRPATPDPSAPGRAVTRSPDSLAGEVDAAGLAKRIAREKGHVVLVNFWATWCVPCREEVPDLARLARAYAGQGLRVLGVSTDLARESAAVRKFLSEQKPGFPNYRKKSGGDDQQFIDAVDRSWGGELPFSVLYARDGKKTKVFSGKHTYREYEEEVVKLVKP